MNYWRGIMNWPLIEGWKCEICDGFYDLTWGLAYGTCRCNNCHAEYLMSWYGENGDIVITTEPRLSEHKEIVKIGWNLLKTPLSEWEQEDWDSFYALYCEEENKHSFALEAEG